MAAAPLLSVDRVLGSLRRSWLLWALVLSTFVACAPRRRESEPVGHGDPSPAPETPAPAGGGTAAPPTRTGPLDVTFAVVSDTHLGFDGNEEKNRALVASIATLPGMRYPGGAAVGHVRGLLVAGDLTEWGNTYEWEAFCDVYGLGRGEKPGSPFPVFEVVGNHDMVHGPWLAAEVAKRHPGGGAYTWDWDDVHLVGLGESPDGPALDALERDLAKTPVERPLVLLFHRPLAGPWLEDRPDAEARARLARLLSGREVLGIFHGHHHARAHYVWQGYDVWKPGAVKGGAPELAVAHVDDERFTVRTYDWQSRRFVDLFTKRRPKRPTSAPRR